MIMNERRQEIRDRRKRYLESLAAVVKTPEGQRVIKELLERLAVGRALSGAEEVRLYNEGMRLYGDVAEAAQSEALFIFGEITGA